MSRAVHNETRPRCPVAGDGHQRIAFFREAGDKIIHVAIGTGFARTERNGNEIVSDKLLKPLSVPVEIWKRVRLGYRTTGCPNRVSGIWLECSGKGDSSGQNACVGIQVNLGCCFPSVLQ